MITKALFSTRTMGILLVVYAFAMALATFVENDYGTPVAKVLVYNCWWFELVMLLLILNFAGNIKRYNLISRKKLPLLVFHLAFIIIFIGGTITRYVSFEGSMHIREGSSSNEIVSDATFLKVQIGKDDQALAYDDVPVTLISNNVPKYLSLFKKNFASEYDYQGARIKLKAVGFYARAQDSLIVNDSGKSTLHLVVVENGQRVNKYIQSGNVKLINDLVVSYNKETPGAINISEHENGYVISSPYEGNYMIMATQERKQIAADNAPQNFNLRSLYTFGTLAFVVPEPARKGNIFYFEGDKKKHEHDLDLVQLEVTTPNAVDTVSFYGGKGLTNFQLQTQVGGYPIALAYGSKIYKAPFELKLVDFKMEKYPGSNSPAAYSSDMLILDGQQERPYKIFMNHVLDQDGFRFFQSSFDEDEKGTILSVNHDFWGTNITYIGYTLLFLGLFVTLFWKGTNFQKLNQQLKSLSKSKAMLLAFLILPAFSAFSQEIDMHGQNGGKSLSGPAEMNAPHNHDGHTHAIDTALIPGGEPIMPGHNHPAGVMKTINATMANGKQFAEGININQAHADQFGSLLVQNIDGRIEPVNTLALEILRKLYHKEKFYSLSANQFFLSISAQPFNWVNVPLIKVGSKGGPDLLKTVKADQDGYTNMANILALDANGGVNFLLQAEYMKSFAKKASAQNGYDKDIIDLNDKFQVMLQLLNGSYLRVFPVAGDQNNTWVAPPAEISQQVSTNPATLYVASVLSALKNNRWNAADQNLDKLKQLQQEIGKNVVPSATKVNMEIRYNSWNIFLNLMISYAILGTVLLFLAFLMLFKNNKKIAKAIKIILFLISFAAILQTFGLAVRWYISGHEPWSNGYEAVMFISLIGVASGLFLYRNSNAFIPAAGCLIAVILMGFAHGGSQMNPQITPLVPVLKSYWLMIHVAIITSSYGFFGLSALLGTVVLCLLVINHPKINAKVKNSITELTIVNEMSLTVGLFLLTVGTFLGGIWANESWGRYWSWDPKETWAFISVIIYAFVLHLRLIPNLRGKYLFNLLSLLAFSVIIMTYFGVNYYLTGLHSYAQGDPVPIPNWVYVTLAIVATLAITAYKRQQKSKSTK